MLLTVDENKHEGNVFRLFKCQWCKYEMELALRQVGEQERVMPDRCMSIVGFANLAVEVLPQWACECCAVNVLWRLWGGAVEGGR